MFGPASVPNGCFYRPVPFWEDRPLITPRSIFAHTMSASVRSTVQSAWNHATARPHKNTLPHYALGLDEQDGCEKFLPTNRRGIGNATVTSDHEKWPTLTDAQRADILAHGNRSISWWSIVIETADTGTNADPTISAFTDYQLEMLTRIYVHECAGWNIPAVKLPEWYGAGCATHTEPWNFPFTTLYVKTCPGSKKKAQFWAEVLPEVQRRLAPTPVPPVPPATTIPTGVALMGAPLVLRYGGTPTSNWSGYYSFDGVARHGVRGLHHAKQLQALGAIDAKTLKPVANPVWSDVTHTNNAEELDEWLTPGRD